MLSWSQCSDHHKQNVGFILPLRYQLYTNQFLFETYSYWCVRLVQRKGAVVSFNFVDCTIREGRSSCTSFTSKTSLTQIPVFLRLPRLIQQTMSRYCAVFWWKWVFLSLKQVSDNANPTGDPFIISNSALNTSKILVTTYNSNELLHSTNKSLHNLFWDWTDFKQPYHQRIRLFITFDFLSTENWWKFYLEHRCLNGLNGMFVFLYNSIRGLFFPTFLTWRFGGVV